MQPRLLFLFLDGVGIGSDDPTNNPLAIAHMPNLMALLDGHRLVGNAIPTHTQRATLLALDANLGVPGTPQSATGQATLLTGRNVAAEIGYHYGPKPNDVIAQSLRSGTIFETLTKRGKRVAFLDAYPPGYFAAIESGRRLHSAVPMAALSAGLRLMTASDLNAGRALAADFTGLGWHDRLNLLETPTLSPVEAGRRLAQLSSHYDFAFFEYWLTDYAGHGREMNQASTLLGTLDLTLGGLLTEWDDAEGLILITSDHGNLEDLSVRGHTLNPVPILVVGASPLRDQFVAGLVDISDIAPAIQRLLA
jgi:2,3-bisphosphoglycerate-independent phosphoglycerate mutase